MNTGIDIELNIAQVTIHKLLSEKITRKNVTKNHIRCIKSKTRSLLILDGIRTNKKEIIH